MTSSFDRLDARLRRHPDWASFAAGTALVAAIAVFRIELGHGILVATFLLISVAAISWLLNR